MAKRGKAVIDRELCKGCYLCIRACSAKVLAEDLQPNTSGSRPATAVHKEKCTACGNCFEVCPDACIEVYELEEAEAV
ncbi:MAG: 4Fe-4S binding protein [Spirochaetaceae bacterium]|jgi:2-oxoglutarate ferredoxin oxidoreductase subunit delta|nr:4Fe-4S binding protein [Spirochaetaceae bacterium]